MRRISGLRVAGWSIVGGASGVVRRIVIHDEIGGRSGPATKAGACRQSDEIAFFWTASLICFSRRCFFLVRRISRQHLTEDGRAKRGTGAHTHRAGPARSEWRGWWWWWWWWWAWAGDVRSGGANLNDSRRRRVRRGEEKSRTARMRFIGPFCAIPSLYIDRETDGEAEISTGRKGS
jgi:hypothetical protein